MLCRQLALPTRTKECYRPAATRVTSRCPRSSVGEHCGHSGEIRQTSKSYASLLHLPDSSRNAKVYSWASGARSPTPLQNKSHLAFRHIQPGAKTFPCCFASHGRPGQNAEKTRQHGSGHPTCVTETSGGSCALDACAKEVDLFIYGDHPQELKGECV